MQKFRKAKIVVSITAIASLLITTIAPVASAASSFNTEGQVKNALYAAAAYECVNNSMLQNTAVGNKRESILIGAETQKVFIGHWLGDSDGMITCKDALTKTLGGGNITENMLKSGQVFNGVYTQSASGEQQIQCNYGIVNSTGNSTLDGTYSWPQGYIKDANGNLVDKRSHGVIQVVFNENGPIRLVGATSDIDTTHTLESMRNWSIDWSQPSKICHNLVMYTEVYPIGQVQNAMGETISVYAEVLATDDPTPFNEWGIHVDDRNRAWLYYSEANSQTKKFTHTLTSVSSSTSLELTSNAKTKLLSNISTLYLNGKTDVASFLDSSADAKYILYGRYLFNGDGAGSFACGGISVATDDPNFSDLSATDYWDTSQPYVASVQAYKDSTATSKTTFRTKFGGDGLTSPGAAKSIYFPGVSGDCKALAGAFNGINPTSTSAKAAVKNFMKVGSVEELPDTNTPGSTDPDGSDGDGTAGALDGCFGNAGVLGWIICPVIKFVGETVGGIYDMIVENYLTMGTATVTDPAVNEAWSKFQGYANIIFAILLVFVILAQVTGIGLSNYGIKKVLPKLIITVILVNVSFILCAVAIDVSNIVGASLNDFLKGIDVGGLGASDFNLAVFATNTLTSLFSVGAAAGGIAIAAYTITISGGWGMLLLPLLLALLTALIGIIFFFLLLGVRQAAIILLLVVSPLAIVCYALPNTKRFFDRWLKMFSSLLLVYPICGLMMGGGNLASRILLTAGSNAGFMYFLVAMLVQVVPFFLIPGVLKSSMTALGGIGAKIAGMGDRLGGWTTRSIKNSRGYQERQQEALRKSNMIRNTNIANRNSKLTEAETARLTALQNKQRTGRLTMGERRELNTLSNRQFRRARALSGNRKIYNEDNMAAAMAQGENYADFAADDPRRLAAIQQYRGRDTEDMSRGYSTMWKNDGTAGSVSRQQAELDSAIASLESDAENQDAQARFRALVRMMSTSDKGRAAMEQSINKRIKALGEAGTNANKGLRWAATEALEGPNGKEFKKVAPSLFNTLSRVSDGGAGNEYSKLATWTDGSGTVHKNFNANGTLSAEAEEGLYTEAIDRMSAELLPEVDDRDFDRYIAGLRTGKITGTAKAKLISSAVDALNDPRIKLKPKTAAKVHEIANMAYTQNTSAADLHGTNFDAISRNDAAAIASAGSSELDRIAEGFRNGTIAKDDPSGDRSDMLNVIQKALEEARLNGGMVGSVQLGSGDASKMLKILKDNGRALVDAGGATLTDADYSSLMRIKHSRASYSSNWRQATAGDVIASGIAGLHEGDWIDVSGTPRRLTSQEVNEVKAVQDFNVRQKLKESADNGTPTSP